jgi:hypothetical protein
MSSDPTARANFVSAYKAAFEAKAGYAFPASSTFGFSTDSTASSLTTAAFCTPNVLTALIVTSECQADCALVDYWNDYTEDYRIDGLLMAFAMTAMLTVLATCAPVPTPDTWTGIVCHRLYQLAIVCQILTCIAALAQFCLGYVRIEDLYAATSPCTAKVEGTFTISRAVFAFSAGLHPTVLIQLTMLHVYMLLLLESERVRRVTDMVALDRKLAVNIPDKDLGSWWIRREGFSRRVMAVTFIWPCLTLVCFGMSAAFVSSIAFLPIAMLELGLMFFLSFLFRMIHSKLAAMLPVAQGKLKTVLAACHAATVGFQPITRGTAHDKVRSKGGLFIGSSMAHLFLFGLAALVLPGTVLAWLLYSGEGWRMVWDEGFLGELYKYLLNAATAVTNTDSGGDTTFDLTLFKDLTCCSHESDWSALKELAYDSSGLDLWTNLSLKPTQYLNNAHMFLTMGIAIGVGKAFLCLLLALVAAARFITPSVAISEAAGDEEFDAAALAAHIRKLQKNRRSCARKGKAKVAVTDEKGESLSMVADGEEKDLLTVVIQLALGQGMGMGLARLSDGRIRVEDLNNDLSPAVTCGGIEVGDYLHSINNGSLGSAEFQEELDRVGMKNAIGRLLNKGERVEDDKGDIMLECTLRLERKEVVQEEPLGGAEGAAQTDTQRQEEEQHLVVAPTSESAISAPVVGPPLDAAIEAGAGGALVMHVPREGIGENLSDPEVADGSIDSAIKEHYEQLLANVKRVHVEQQQRLDDAVNSIGQEIVPYGAAGAAASEDRSVEAIDRTMDSVGEASRSEAEWLQDTRGEEKRRAFAEFEREKELEERERALQARGEMQALEMREREIAEKEKVLVMREAQLVKIAMMEARIAEMEAQEQAQAQAKELAQQELQQEKKKGRRASEEKEKQEVDEKERLEKEEEEKEEGREREEQQQKEEEKERQRKEKKERKMKDKEAKRRKEAERQKQEEDEEQEDQVQQEEGQEQEGQEEGQDISPRYLVLLLENEDILSAATAADLTKGAMVYAQRGEDYEGAVVQFPSKKKPEHWALKFESDGKILPKALALIKLKRGDSAGSSADSSGEANDGEANDGEANGEEANGNMSKSELKKSELKRGRDVQQEQQDSGDGSEREKERKVRRRKESRGRKNRDKRRMPTGDGGEKGVDRNALAIAPHASSNSSSRSMVSVDGPGCIRHSVVNDKQYVKSMRTHGKGTRGTTLHLVGTDELERPEYAAGRASLASQRAASQRAASDREYRSSRHGTGQRKSSVTKTMTSGGEAQYRSIGNGSSNQNATAMTAEAEAAAAEANATSLSSIHGLSMSSSSADVSTANTGESVEQWLKSRRIKIGDASRYASLLAEEGCEQVEHLRCLTEADMVGVGMKKLHARIVLDAVGRG